ncbi:MAG: hypothetical protein WBE34_13940 [Candidatus Nitrosopolaris sp.]
MRKKLLQVTIQKKTNGAHVNTNGKSQTSQLSQSDPSQAKTAAESKSLKGTQLGKTMATNIGTFYPKCIKRQGYKP